MEEEKAAEYYDELVRKGGNAAKFKQGLGFGSHATAVPSSEKYGSLNNFVKQASPGRSAALEREIRAEAIQEKLKKGKTEESSDYRGSRPRLAEEDDGNKPLNDAVTLAGRKRGRGEIDQRDRRREKSGNDRRSSSSEHRERRRSPDSSRQKSTKRRRPSPAVSSDSNSGQSSRSRRRRRRGERQKSVSPAHEKSTTRRSDRGSTRKDGHSPSPSDEGRRRRVSSGRKENKRRHYSPSLSSDSSSGESYDSRKRTRNHRDKRVSPAIEKSGSRRRERRSTRRDSRSPCRSDEKRKSRDSSRQRSSKRRHYSPVSASGSSSSGESYDSRKRRRDQRDRNVSPTYRRFTSRREDRGFTRKRSYSPSRSDGRRGNRVRSRTRSRSRSRGRDSDRRVSYRRKRSSSPYNASYRGRRDEVPRTYETHRHSNTRSRHEGGRDETSRESRYGKSETASQSRSLKGKEKPPERDYSKLIPNFDSMTPAEKIKAKMKLQLSETVVKDQAKGMTDEWERFDFDKNAPLDDDAKLDYFGDGTGAKDDTGFLNNSGSSFPSSTNQVKREALVTAAHDEAIFGPAGGLSLRTEKPVGEAETRGRRPSEEPTLVLFEPEVIATEGETSRGIGGIWPNGSAANGKDAHQHNSGVVSDRIIATQNTETWQERAQKLREKRNAGKI